MAFEDIPEDKEISIPCECGGNITLIGEYWECDGCDFKRKNKSEGPK